MNINDLKELWGIPIKILKDFNKKYIKFTLISYTIDIIVFSIIVYFMLMHNVSYQSFFICCLIVCFAFTMYSSIFISKDKIEACRFYRKHKNSKVEEAYFNVNEKRLYSVLYCSGCKRVKENKNLDYYLELIISMCSEDYSNARTIMKYLSKYEVEEGSENAMPVYIIKGSGKKSYFVSFINSEESKDMEVEEDE